MSPATLPLRLKSFLTVQPSLTQSVRVLFCCFTQICDLLMTGLMAASRPFDVTVFGMDSAVLQISLLSCIRVHLASTA
jgi:hypothetical protein